MRTSKNLFSEPEDEPGKKDGNTFEKLFGSTEPCEPTKPVTLPSAVQPNPKFFFWAMRNIPIKWILKHLLIVGASGSGKTTAILLFIQSIIYRVRLNVTVAQQVIAFDAKCNLIPFLAALGFKPEDEDVFILNPFDARSVYWDISEAVTGAAMARYVAAQFIEEEKGSSAPYFYQASRELVFAVLIALAANREKQPWDLRDFLCAFSSRETIAAVVKGHQRASEIVARIIGDEKNSAGVISTLGAKLGQFEEVAALWATCKNKKKFSVKEFLSHSGVLVLGNDPVMKESLKPINNIILKSLADEGLQKSDTSEPRTFYILDEFPDLGKCDSVHHLLTMGRSKGISILLGTQTNEGLEAVYGKQITEDIYAQCAHKTFLRAGAPGTAKWAEEYFGQVRYTENTVTQSGNSTSTQYAVRDRSLFLASSFLNLPFPDSGLYGSISDVPSEECVFVTRRSFPEIRSWIIKEADMPVREVAFKRSQRFVGSQVALLTNLTRCIQKEFELSVGNDRAANIATEHDDPSELLTHAQSPVHNLPDLKHACHSAGIPADEEQLLFREPFPVDGDLHLHDLAAFMQEPEI